MGVTFCAPLLSASLSCSIILRRSSRICERESDVRVRCFEAEESLTSYMMGAANPGDALQRPATLSNALQHAAAISPQHTATNAARDPVAHCNSTATPGNLAFTDGYQRAGLTWLKAWPIWLRALPLSNDTSLASLPHVSVTCVQQVAGVTYYRLHVQHACDMRANWSVVHRFSAFCKLHEDVRAQVPSYASHLPRLSQELLAERSAGGGGWLASAAARAAREDRRKQLLAAYLLTLLNTVEVLASAALR